MLSLPQMVGAAAGQRRVQASALNGLSAAHSLRGMPLLTPSPARAAPVAERQSSALRCQAVAAPEAPPVAAPLAGKAPPLHVVIAGAGIGGLLLAVGLLKKGFKVTVLERDLTAIRGEGKYRGPIQVQSNALAALEALDRGVAERVFEEGCITGDRVNGLCDGVSGEWYVKFDTFHPAVDRGLPVTRVISRYLLQEILADRARALGGEDIIVNDITVVDYEQERDAATGRTTSVTAVCDDGRRFKGDILVGADGIWSKVRTKLIGPTEANYSEYTCYTGIADWTPADIDTVGYRVYLGNGQYFVSSDVGSGKMQWYAFHREVAGGTDEPGRKKERLLKIFGHWSHMVTDLIRATPEDDVLRRDIYDRPPIFKWTEGRVALLGDSAHAMQPNLGQGGGMAIEDAYQLVQDLTGEAQRAERAQREMDVESVLRGYQGKRLGRASAIHGMAGMAAYMASTYKAYLGEGLGPLSWLTNLKIHHPGRVAGRVVMNATMPGVLAWVLGGYQNSLDIADRAPACQINDKPLGFDHESFAEFMADDAALRRAANAVWVLEPAVASAGGGDGSDAGAALAAAQLAGAVVVGSSGVTVGAAPASTLRLSSPRVAAEHARVEARDGDYWVTDLGSEGGTYLNGKRLEAQTPTMVVPGNELRFGGAEGGDAPAYFVKMQHTSVVEGGHGSYERRAWRPAAAAGASH